MRKRVSELMDVCGLPNRYVNMYPHELDGGQRQRWDWPGRWPLILSSSYAMSLFLPWMYPSRPRS